jgi:hypothetical protein
MSKIAIILCLLLGLSHAQCNNRGIQHTAACLPSAGWPDFVSMKLKIIVKHAKVAKWHCGTGIALQI